MTPKGAEALGQEGDLAKCCSVLLWRSNCAGVKVIWGFSGLQTQRKGEVLAHIT